MTDATAHYHPDLSIDQQVALRTAATRLVREFDGTYGAETIDRFLHTSYDQFAALSGVPNFLPLLAERFASQCLHALARVEGIHAGGLGPSSIAGGDRRAGRPVALRTTTYRPRMSDGQIDQLMRGDDMVVGLL